MNQFGSLPDVWFEPLITFEQIKRSFHQGKQDIRIATGFFTIAGWNLIKSYVRNKKVYLLVGILEPSEGQARNMLVAEIIKDLSRGSGDNRRQAVKELVERLELKLFGIVDARSMKHHAKLYLVDRSLAIFSSANTTYNGFIDQNESGNVVKSKKKVEYLVNQFDLYFSQANDISEELLEALKRWLRLVTPWDIYLKTMLCLEDIKPTRRQYKEPASFQRDIIARVLRNLKTHRGSYLVASTGLGKTVLATSVALQLFEANEIDRVMVIAPKQVHKMWDDELGLASLNGKFFTYFTLFQTDSDRDSSLDDFEAIAENLFNDKWLLILDESHVLRNRVDDKGNQQTAFNRLLPLIRRSGCKVIAMTGSPMSTDSSNINNQLLLLPHTASPNVLLPEYFENSEAWSINHADELRNFPVASLMSMPHVAGNYGKTDERGLYIMYGQQKKYIPEVVLHRVDYNLMLEDEMAHLFKEGYLEEGNTFWGTSVEAETRVVWASSPKALEEALKKVLNTPGRLGYDLVFCKPLAARRKAITPILKKLATTPFGMDIKFRALKKIVEEEFSKGRKIIIFCERLATAVYLENGLNESLPTVRVFTTVEKRQAHKYDFKRDQEITNGILGFAPESNVGYKKEKSDRRSKKESLPTYDILITTDAFGVGINLQDASVVINYDAAWTPISPIQRAGRVLRPWKDPRTVQIYTFVPNVVNSNEEWKLNKIGLRWDNLKNRHDESLRIIELPVLPEQETRQIYMPDVASTVTIRSVPLDIEELSDIEVSSFFVHTSKLQQDRERAIALPDDITSALIYNGKYHAVYVLLRIGEDYRWVLYNLDKRKLEELTDLELLNIIQCTDEMPTALVDPDRIEDCATSAIQMWCDKNKVNCDSVYRICTLYLHPNNQPEPQIVYKGDR